MKNKKELNVKCISLVGELADTGKHIYMADMGVTICGYFTTDYDKEQFKGMPEGVPQGFKIEEWDITCKSCIDLTYLMKEHKQKTQKA